MMTGLAVVTGASGHIGANLVRTLLANGRKVRVLIHRDSRAIEGLDVERAGGDVLDFDSLVRAFRGAAVVFHLAARVPFNASPTEDGGEWEVNVAGTRNVARACLAAGVGRMVHFSSIHALCMTPKSKAIDEKLPLADTSLRCMPYDRAKSQAEREVQEAVAGGLDAVVVNPTAAIGPHDFRLSPMGRVLLDFFKGKFPALVPGGFDWVDARDVADGAISAEEKGKKGHRYILSGHYASVRDIARLVEEVAGTAVPKIVAPFWLALTGASLYSFGARLLGRTPLYTSESIRILHDSGRVSRAKAEAELGYRPRPLKDTIRDTFEWLRSEGMV